MPGPVAILSRSGTLTYEVADRLTRAGIGQSLCVGIGGDPFIGTSFVDLFEMIRNHDETKAVVVLGEIGGQAEENLAEYVLRHRIRQTGRHLCRRTDGTSRQTARPCRGHTRTTGRASSTKLETMRKAGFVVCPSLKSIARLTESVLK